MSDSNPAATRRRRQLTATDHVEGVRSADLTTLAQTITLVESRTADDRELATDVITQLMPYTGASIRVGITGVPGVGKSTFLDALGSHLTSMGHRVAVLAVDPSSGVSGGSILGDKTRMPRLTADPNAFVRPSPATGTLGGVSARTREAMLVCEAAGFDVVLVETVGVGQSETVAAELTDTFLALMLPGAGDELQGIKRGLMELADILAVNKADGERVGAAASAARDLRAALRLLHPSREGWRPPVLTCSGLTGEGIPEVWEAVLRHRESTSGSGEFQARRSAQNERWMWTLVEQGVHDALHADAGVAKLARTLEADVATGSMPATVAARHLLRAFLDRD